MFAARLAVTAARTAHAAHAAATVVWHLLQLSRSAYYAPADPVAAGACREDGPAPSNRGGVSATILSESNCYCTDGALEGLGGLETRPLGLN